MTSGPMPSPPITAMRKAAIARSFRGRYGRGVGEVVGPKGGEVAGWWGGGRPRRPPPHHPATSPPHHLSSHRGGRVKMRRRRWAALGLLPWAAAGCTTDSARRDGRDDPLLGGLSRPAGAPVAVATA